MVRKFATDAEILAKFPPKNSAEVSIHPGNIKEAAARGRKPLAPADKVGPDFVGKTPTAMAEPEARMHLALHEADINASALAEQLGYEGTLTVGALEDEIRFYQRRTVEASLELGKRLLVLKELTPHGEFEQRIELLGISRQMGNKFMAATLRFSKGSAPSLLKAAGNQSKLLELLTLDDGEIAALEAGESARGITLDEIDTMSMRELRAALREAKAGEEAHERILAGKDKLANELDKRLRKTEQRIATEEPDETLDALRRSLAGFALEAEAVLAGKLLPAVRAIQDHHVAHGGDSLATLDGTLRQIERMAATIRVETGMPEAGEDLGAPR